MAPFTSHPTDHELTEFLDDSASPGRTARNARVVQHLLGECPFCTSRLGNLKAERLRVRSESVWDYDRAFGSAERMLELFLVDERPIDRPPEILLAELAPLPRKDRSDRQRLLPTLVKWLAARSHSVRYKDPSEMLHWARMAQLAAESCSTLQVTGTRKRADLRARAWGQFGNALRVCGRLREAEDALTLAERHCRAGTGDSILRAKLREQLTSLYMFQRRFESAHNAIGEAAAIYEELEDRQGLAGALVLQGIVVQYAGQPDETLLLLRRALPLIDGREDQHLLLAARHNMVLCHLELGNPQKALEAHLRNHVLRERASDPLIILRTEWEQGQLLRELGHLEFAEFALCRVRDGFAERGLAYEAAMVSLDLASVHAKQGRPPATGRVIAEAIPVFRALRIDRETLASMAELRRTLTH